MHTLHPFHTLPYFFDVSNPLIYSRLLYLFYHEAPKKSAKEKVGPEEPTKQTICYKIFG
jgi:hypothetical protein